jgi:hypothetical protein
MHTGVPWGDLRERGYLEDLGTNCDNIKNGSETRGTGRDRED